MREACRAGVAPSAINDIDRPNNDSVKRRHRRVGDQWIRISPATANLHPPLARFDSASPGLCQPLATPSFTSPGVGPNGPYPVPAKFPGVGAIVLVDRGKGRGNAGILVGGIPIIPSRARYCRPPEPALGVGGYLYMWDLACMHFHWRLSIPRVVPLLARPPAVPRAGQCKPGADIAGVNGLDWPPVICTCPSGIGIGTKKACLLEILVFIFA